MRTIRVMVFAVGISVLGGLPLGVAAWPTPCMAAVLFYQQAKASLYTCLQISGSAGYCHSEISTVNYAADLVESACSISE